MAQTRRFMTTCHALTTSELELDPSIAYTLLGPYYLRSLTPTVQLYSYSNGGSWEIGPLSIVPMAFALIADFTEATNTYTYGLLDSS